MMVNQLQNRGSFTVVGAPGNDVLRLSAAVLQLAPNAPKDDTRSRGIGRSRIYTEGAGSITLGAEIGESVTGKAVALIRDTKTSSGVWGINNRVTNYSDVLNSFSSWGAQLNRALVDLQNNDPGGAANE